MYHQIRVYLVFLYLAIYEWKFKSCKIIFTKYKMSNVYGLRKKAIVNYSSTKKKCQKSWRNFDWNRLTGRIKRIKTKLVSRRAISRCIWHWTIATKWTKLDRTVEIGTDPYQQNDEPVVERFSTENQSKPFYSFPDLRSKEFIQIKENCPFNLIKVVQNEKELVQFFRSEFLFTYIKKSHKVGCSECLLRRSGHDMRKQLRLCKWKNPECFIEFKVHICEVSGTSSIYQSLGAYRVMVQLDKNVRNGILKLPISLIP